MRPRQVRILVCVGLVLISLWLPTAAFAKAKPRVLDNDTFIDPLPKS